MRREETKSAAFEIQDASDHFSSSSRSFGKGEHSEMLWAYWKYECLVRMNSACRSNVDLREKLRTRRVVFLSSFFRSAFSLRSPTAQQGPIPVSLNLTDSSLLSSHPPPLSIPTETQPRRASLSLSLLLRLPPHLSPPPRPPQKPLPLPYRRLGVNSLTPPLSNLQPDQLQLHLLSTRVDFPFSPFLPPLPRLKSPGSPRLTSPSLSTFKPPRNEGPSLNPKKKRAQPSSSPRPPTHGIKHGNQNRRRRGESPSRSDDLLPNLLLPPSLDYQNRFFDPCRNPTRGYTLSQILEGRKLF